MFVPIVKLNNGLLIGGVAPPINDGYNPRIFGPVVGNKNIPILKKLKKLYSTNGWDADVDNPDNEFFFIKNTNQDIIGAVRICNSKHGNFPLELGFDLIHEDYRGQGLYLPLLKARLNHVKTKEDGYVCYTENDKLKQLHIDAGMTLSPNTKVIKGGTSYWRIEYNVPAEKLVIHPNGTCTGLHIGNIDNKGVIFTAGHCVENDTDPTVRNPGAIRYRNIDNEISDVSNVIQQGYSITNTIKDSALLYTDIPHDTTNIAILTNPESLPEGFKLIAYGRVNEKTNTTIKELDDNKQNINQNFGGVLEALYDKNYEDMKNYKNSIRGLCGTILAEGDSGGPVGYYVGRQFILVGCISTFQHNCTYITNVRIDNPEYSNIPNNIIINKVTYEAPQGELQQGEPPQLNAVQLIDRFAETKAAELEARRYEEEEARLAEEAGLKAAADAEEARLKAAADAEEARLKAAADAQQQQQQQQAEEEARLKAEEARRAPPRAPPQPPPQPQAPPRAPPPPQAPPPPAPPFIQVKKRFGKEQIELLGKNIDEIKTEKDVDDYIKELKKPSGNEKINTFTKIYDKILLKGLEINQRFPSLPTPNKKLTVKKELLRFFIDYSRKDVNEQKGILIGGVGLELTMEVSMFIFSSILTQLFVNRHDVIDEAINEKNILERSGILDDESRQRLIKIKEALTLISPKMPYIDHSYQQSFKPRKLVLDMPELKQNTMEDIMAHTYMTNMLLQEHNNQKKKLKEEKRKLKMYKNN